MARIRVNIEGFFEPTPGFYPAGATLAEMAAIDSANVQHDPIEAVHIMEEGTIEITVEPWSSQ